MKKTIMCLIISSLSMSAFAGDFEKRVETVREDGRSSMKHDAQSVDLRIDQRYESQKYREGHNHKDKVVVISEKRHYDKKYQEGDRDRDNHKEKVIMRFEKRHNHIRDRNHYHQHKMKQEVVGYKVIHLPNDMQQRKMLPNESLIDKVPVHKFH